MSRVILCSGKKANKPYILKSSGIAVYTAEELCYCLRDQLDMLDESVIDRDMAMFIEHELGLPDRGKLLEELIATHSDLESRLVAIFCSCDYYNEAEIRSICEELRSISVMSALDRQKRRADRYLKNGCYSAALREYRNIISSPEAGSMSPEAYGAVLHNLGVLRAGEGRLDEAAEFFREAYERNRRNESLKSYLFALKLAHRDDTFMTEAMRILDSGDLVNRLENEYSIHCDNLAQSGDMDDINRLKTLLHDGRAIEFDRLANEIIEGLKRSYRA